MVETAKITYTEEERLGSTSAALVLCGLSSPRVFGTLSIMFDRYEL